MAATMYPSELLEFDKRSKEDLIYKALRDGLSSEYHVFHSQQIRHVDDSVILREKEIDFLIYHKGKGILCLEAKYCNPRNKLEFGFHNKRWQYSNKTEMRGGGPFMQAKYEQLAVMNNVIRPALEEKCRSENPCAGYKDINDYCDEFFDKFKVGYGVCFHGLTKAEVNAMTFPPEASKDLVLSLDDFSLGKTEKAIDKLFSIQISNCSQGILTDKEHEWILKKVLCPAFNIRVSSRTGALYEEIMYSHLLQEQVSVLNFLEGQHSVVINGLAGTGKTYVAMEWARRCASRNERVLYICFNSALKDFLEEQFRQEDNRNLVDFRTFAGYIMNDLGVKESTSSQQYLRADEKITDMLGHFPYQHVIVDEGQDCALSYIEDSHFIDDMKEIVLYDSGDGKRRSFYLFYDQHQIIAGRGGYIKCLPRVIRDSDAKLTLYKNCRNTRAIAAVSTKGVLNLKQRLVMANGVSDGVNPEFYCAKSKEDAYNRVIQIASGCRDTFSAKDIVVLSSDPSGLADDGYPENSIVKSKLSKRDGKIYFNNVYEFSTYRKFKGLDRAVVILVDVTKDCFIGDQSCMPFYEGSSRARQRLYVVSSLSEDDCSDILKKFEEENRIKRDSDCEKAYALELIEDHLGGEVKD